MLLCQATAASNLSVSSEIGWRYIPPLDVIQQLVSPLAVQVGTPRLRNLDPFLMLDELKLPLNQAAAGFPDHPHR